MWGGDPVADLIAVGRGAVSGGLVRASGGNLSHRTGPGAAGLVTATGTWLDRLTPGDFVPLDSPRASVEVALHREVYRVRPDVNAIVHLHPQTAVLLSTLGESVRLITSDHRFYLRRVVTVPFHPPGTADLARVAAAAAAEGVDCIVLAHHGCSVLGASVEQAYRRALNLEEAALLTYRALLLGRPIVECPPWSSGVA